MNIYVQDGQKYIYLNKDELEELEWDEYRLLELEHDGVGWTIQQSKVAAAKVIGGKPDVEET